jgi:hypothetical protein
VSYLTASLSDGERDEGWFKEKHPSLWD